MLRKELGDKQWKELIKKYVANYGGQGVTTSDFIDVVNQVSEEPMDWFFKQWVYGIGHPKFKMDYEFDKEKQEFTLDILQVQNRDSLVYGKKIPFFKGKMRIEIDDRVKAIEIAAKSKNSYTFSLPQVPKLVNIDFEDTWIKEVEPITKSQEQLLKELHDSKDALHRVAVMRKLTKIALEDGTAKQIKSKIKAALGNSVLNEEYWRMRVIALGSTGSAFSVQFQWGHSAG